MSDSAPTLSPSDRAAELADMADHVPFLERLVLAATERADEATAAAQRHYGPRWERWPGSTYHAVNAACDELYAARARLAAAREYLAELRDA